MSNVSNNQRARRYLPSEPLNKHPTSPTLPVAKLRLFTDLYGNRDLRKLGNNRSQSNSPTPWQGNTDRMAMSLPGTPIRTNGYHSPLLDRPTNLYRGSAPKMPTTSNLLALSPPSLPSIPSYFSHHDRYGSSGYLGGHNTAGYSSNHHRYNQYNPSYYSTNSVNQSYYNHHSSHPDWASYSNADYGHHQKYLPGHSYSTDSPSRHRSGYHHHRSGLPEQYLRSRSYVIANQNNSLRDAIKSELKHYADDRKRYTNADLMVSDQPFIPGSSSYSNRYNYNKQRYLGTSNSLYRNHILPHNTYDTAAAMSIHGHHLPHHHRSESDLNALLDLHSDPPDPWMEKSPPPGVPQMYLNRNASYPSIESNSLSMHPYYESTSYPSPSRYAQSSYLNRYKYRY